MWLFVKNDFDVWDMAETFLTRKDKLISIKFRFFCLCLKMLLFGNWVVIFLSPLNLDRRERNLFYGYWNNLRRLNFDLDMEIKIICLRICSSNTYVFTIYKFLVHLPKC
jgi:hypothetical protein